MEIKKIYIDMDGVLVDFDRGVKELLNLNPEPQEGASDEYTKSLWEKARQYPNFYYKLQPIENMIELVNDLIAKYGDKVEILTGIPRKERGVETAAQDKIDWIRKYVSNDIKVNTVRRKDKKNFCLGKEYILIDDYTKNTNEWIEAGGTALLFKSAKDLNLQFESLFKKEQEEGIEL